MAASNADGTLGEHVPRYESNDLNSQVIHIGSFRTSWLETLPPDLYSYEIKSEEIEIAQLAEVLQIPTETLNELKDICRFVTQTWIWVGFDLLML